MKELKSQVGDGKEKLEISKRELLPPPGLVGLRDEVVLTSSGIEPPWQKLDSWSTGGFSWRCHQKLRERRGRNALASLSFSHSVISCCVSYWLNPPGSQLARAPGKCSLQGSAPCGEQEMERGSKTNDYGYSFYKCVGFRH